MKKVKIGINKTNHSIKTGIHHFASEEEVVDVYRFSIDNPFVNVSMLEVKGDSCYNK